MRALLPAAALTLARARGTWPGAGLPPVRFQVDLTADPAYAAFFGLGEPFPLPYLYLYAQRAQLACMVARDFPYRVPGVIHLANEQRLLAVPEAGPLALEVAVGPADTPGRRCVAFDVAFEQAGKVVATCRSVYLVRKEAGGPPKEPPRVETLASQAAWRFPADEGRRYAALAGDYNPVHLHPLTARLFGFRRPILHGMDAVARVAAAVGTPLTALDVEFKRPIALPGAATLAWEGGRFQVTSGETIHLEGRYA